MDNKQEAIEALRKFNTKPAVKLLKHWFEGEDVNLTRKDFEEIMEVWEERFFPEKCSVNIDIDDETFAMLNQMANEEGLTLDQLVTLALEEQIKEN